MKLKQHLMLLSGVGLLMSATACSDYSKQKMGMNGDTNKNLSQASNQAAQKLDDSLSNLEKQIDSLKDRSDNMNVAQNVKDQNNEMIKQLEQKKDQADDRLDELKSATADQANQAMSRAQQAINDLQKSVARTQTMIASGQSTQNQMEKQANTQQQNNEQKTATDTGY
jgi:predicted  nucleic acid-binding Zn-ribbon protein